MIITNCSNGILEIPPEFLIEQVLRYVSVSRLELLRFLKKETPVETLTKALRDNSAIMYGYGVRSSWYCMHTGWLKDHYISDVIYSASGISLSIMDAYDGKLETSFSCKWSVGEIASVLHRILEADAFVYVETFHTMYMPKAEIVQMLRQVAYKIGLLPECEEISLPVFEYVHRDTVPAEIMASFAVDLMQGRICRVVSESEQDAEGRIFSRLHQCHHTMVLMGKEKCQKLRAHFYREGTIWTDTRMPNKVFYSRTVHNKDLLPYFYILQNEEEKWNIHKHTTGGPKIERHAYLLQLAQRVNTK